MKKPKKERLSAGSAKQLDSVAQAIEYVVNEVKCSTKNYDLTNPILSIHLQFGNPTGVSIQVVSDGYFMQEFYWDGSATKPTAKA